MVWCIYFNVQFQKLLHPIVCNTYTITPCFHQLVRLLFSSRSERIIGEHTRMRGWFRGSFDGFNNYISQLDKNITWLIKTNNIGIVYSLASVGSAMAGWIWMNVNECKWLWWIWMNVNKCIECHERQASDNQIHKPRIVDKIDPIKNLFNEK